MRIHLYIYIYIYLIAPRIPPGQVKGRVECCVWVLGGACGSARGGPGRALGGQLSAKALWRTVAKNGKIRSESLGGPWGVHGGPGGVPGSSLGGLGGPWGVPGRSQASFWAPRSAPDDKGAHPGGSLGGSRRAEKSPETIFLRSQEGKCVYF